MFVGDKVIYLELHKTGCSHVRRLLEAIPGCEGRLVGKHNSLDQLPSEMLGDTSQKIIFGNIRNPWDWYVSLWAYGCMGKGSIHANATRRTLTELTRRPSQLFKPLARWEQVYSDAYSPELFQQWLELVLVTRRQDIGTGFGESPISNFAGLLTFRYLKLFTRDFNRAKKLISNVDELESHDRKNNLTNYIIKNENLEPELKEILMQCGLPENDIDEAFGAGRERTNPSNREDYAYYYDEKARELVAQRERYLIEKYDYRF